ncbi:MAG: acetyl-CoA carboxylase carboxyltransferase subunit alpha [Verrucomicrobiae bacterium]|nr:acetyl-CoA carboxylase carboxyltransferase subunit alpha [Verrucomicrobiae bacterium]
MSTPPSKVAPLEFEKPITELEKILEQLQTTGESNAINTQEEIAALQKKIATTRKEIYAHLTPWQRIQIVRHPSRPYTLDYIQEITSHFYELSGDRLFGNDQAIIGGFATIDNFRLIIIGHQKGRDTKENLRRNFGCAHPEGYRKALRLMRLADKFDLPIVTLIDTPGAYPGIGAEERHIAEAIAVNIREMFTLRVPIIAVVIGEGGSGGALGIGVADRVLIMENAYYSVISPEGCAAILWKDRAYAPQAAEVLKISAKDLKEFGLVDEIIPEPLGGAHHDKAQAAANLKKAILKHLKTLHKIPDKELIQTRYERYRAYGKYKLT